MATIPAANPLVNVGRPDRAIRIVVGFLVLTLGLLFESWWGLLGFIPLFTGMAGFCPFYRLLGINTCPARQPRS